MLTIEQWMKLIDYKITDGYDFQWQCYGVNAYGLDSWNDYTTGHSIGIIFDTKTQQVYEVSAHDYANSRSYRMIHPDFIKAHTDERTRRNINDTAYDDVKFVDLELSEDFIEKATAIINRVAYDTRVSISIELEDDMMFELMKQAHAQDITFNQQVENILRIELDNNENLR